MRMYTQAFNKMVDLNDYVNEKGISKKDIVNVFQTSDGLFILMYYAD